MPRKLSDLIATLSQARRKRIEVRAMELAALMDRKKLHASQQRARATD